LSLSLSCPSAPAVQISTICTRNRRHHAKSGQKPSAKIVPALHAFHIFGPTFPSVPNVMLASGGCNVHMQNDWRQCPQKHRTCLKVTVVMHVALMLDLRILDHLVLICFPLSTSVPINFRPCVGSSSLGTTQPTERLPTRATNNQIAPAILLDWHRALRTGFTMSLHTEQRDCTWCECPHSRFQPRDAVQSRETFLNSTG
jgi:hypothetical protein